MHPYRVTENFKLLTGRRGEGKTYRKKNHLYGSGVTAGECLMLHIPLAGTYVTYLCPAC